MNAISVPPSHTVEQAAAQLGCSYKTVQRLIRDGKLKSYKPGPKCMLIDAQSLEELLAERQATKA
jgi:excisionase family DNA binding protein